MAVYNDIAIYITLQVYPCVVKKRKGCLAVSLKLPSLPTGKNAKTQITASTTKHCQPIVQVDMLAKVLYFQELPKNSG